MIARPFSYNPSKIIISGTTQVGNIAIGISAIDYSGNPGGVKWWNGPNEELGYVICCPTPTMQGLSWNNTGDTYSRTDSISGVTPSQSAGNVNLPIHADMKRCVVLDNGVVNYYIDPINPINKQGVDFMLVGVTTSTTTGHLIDTGGNFIVNGVKVGQYVKNVTSSTYAMITSVAATDLTLGIDIITSGQNYSIGSAIYNGDDGNVMVQIPKFYYYQDLSGTTKTWKISKYQISGYTLHPAFFKDGIEVDYRYMSAFEGSMYDVSISGFTTSANIPVQMYDAGDKLKSVANQWPKTSETRAAYRSMAQSNGTIWRQMDYYLLSAVQLLYLIEYGNFNSQSMIGAGRTNLSGGGWTADSYIGRTGFSVKDGNNTASDQVGGSSGYMTDYMSYRGIENFFGNVWKFIDGMTIDMTLNNTTSPIPIYVSNNSSYFADTGSVNMQLLVNETNIGATNEGYISNIENCTGFIPSAVGASSTTKLTDYLMQYSSNGNGWRAPWFGASSTNGSIAGCFAFYASNAWSVFAVNVSARLCL